MAFSTTANISTATPFSEYPNQLTVFMNDVQSYINTNYYNDFMSYVNANGFGDDAFTLFDSTDPTKKAKFELSGITAGAFRAYSLPNANCTLATISTVTQTFSGTTTFSGTFTASGTTATLGSGTGAITANVGTGATTTGTTKTVNIGTNGVSGSTTNINIGSAVSGANNNITLNDSGLAGALIGEMFYQTNAALGLVDQTANQKILGVGVTLAGNSTYEIEGYFNISKTAGATSMYLGLQMISDGTLTISGLNIQVISRFGATLTAVEPVDNFGTISALATTLALHPASTAASVSTQVYFKGVVDVNVGGVFTPMINQSAVAGGASTIGKLAVMKARRLGAAGANSSKGTWV